MSKSNVELCVRGLRAENWMAISLIDWPIPETGVIVEGGNARGKSSALKALMGALTARGVEPAAVRLGETEAVLEVDLGHFSVRRVIDRNAKKGHGRVEVRREDGTKVPAPQTFLDELLGPSIDPLDLFLAKPAERRGKILEAVHAKVTIDQLRAWAPDVDEKTDVTADGFEVLERVGKLYYDRRHDQNAVAKRARADANRALAAVEEQRRVLPVGEIAPTDVVRRAVEEHRQHLAKLELTNREAARAEAEAAKGREQIEKLRAEAKELTAKHPEVDSETLRVARTVAGTWRSDVEDLERRLETARAELRRADEHVAKLSQRDLDARNARERAAGMERQAESFESMLERVTAKSVPASQIEDAAEQLEDSERDLAAAEQRDRVVAEERKAAALVEAAEAAEKEASRLDSIVKALREDAPRALFAGAGIEGLTLEDDGDVALHGVKLGSLSGMESLRFATKIAKLAGKDAKLKLLVVDGMERLDAEQRIEFEEMATEGGWQLFGTFVTSGDVAVKSVHRAKVEEGAAA